MVLLCEVESSDISLYLCRNNYYCQIHNLGDTRHMHDAETVMSQPAATNFGMQNKLQQTLSLWQRLTLGVILLLSAFLEIFHLGQNHYGPITTSVNSYY